MVKLPERCLVFNYRQDKVNVVMSMIEPLPRRNTSNRKQMQSKETFRIKRGNCEVGQTEEATISEISGLNLMRIRIKSFI